MRIRYEHVIAALILGCCIQLGCCMCCNPFDDYYNAYGGIKQRANMTCGRVGSAFNNAEAGPIADVESYSSGEVMNEYGSSDGSQDLPFDDALDEGPESVPGFYGESGFGDLYDEDVEQLPTPADAPSDLSEPGDPVESDFGFPDVPSLDETAEPNTALPLP